MYYLCDRYYDKVHWDGVRLTLNQLHRYEAAIQEACRIKGIWGLIDGTVRPIARPTERQEEYYSGHKCYHGPKYQ